MSVLQYIHEHSLLDLCLLSSSSSSSFPPPLRQGGERAAGTQRLSQCISVYAKRKTDQAHERHFTPLSFLPLPLRKSLEDTNVISSLSTPAEDIDTDTVFIIIAIPHQARSRSCLLLPSFLPSFLPWHHSTLARTLTIGIPSRGSHPRSTASFCSLATFPPAFRQGLAAYKGCFIGQLCKKSDGRQRSG